MEIIKNQHFHLPISCNPNVRIFEDKSRIRFDESMETYDSTNPRFGIEYSNIRIRSNKNAVHCQGPLVRTPVVRKGARNVHEDDTLQLAIPPMQLNNNLSVPEHELRSRETHRQLHRQR